MARRLTVIISQSSMRHSQAADVEERLLTELMVTAGMDATLVGPLDNVQLDSTDYLCLSSFSNQTLAVVSPLSFEQVVEQWSRLQLDGQVVRMGQAGRMGQRRVVYFPLSSDTAATLDSLRQMLVDQAVKTVDVILPLGKTAQTSLPLASAATQPPATQQTAGVKPSGSHAARPSPGPSLPLSTRPSIQAASPATRPCDPLDDPEEEWPDLDRLVDDLDALDL